jgi:hypothetical protein
MLHRKLTAWRDDRCDGPHTRKTNASLILALQDVEQGIQETGMLLDLRKKRVLGSAHDGIRC